MILVVAARYRSPRRGGPDTDVLLVIRKEVYLVNEKE